ncbi:MAG: FAD binding domain-containing protein [Azospirillaceae bacterium]
MHPFDHQAPDTLAAAVKALAEDEDAQALAGGMSLVPVLRHRLAAPSVLVDLSRIPDLSFIRDHGDRLEIGAMTKHATVAASPEVRRRIPALAGLAGDIGDPLVRNRGTIGGSLANNDPAACYPSALLGLGGTVRTDRREIAADDFILGTFETALAPGELIVAVSFPVPEMAVHLKEKNFASRFSVVGLFLSRTGGRVRIGVTGAGPHAFRPTAFEDALSADFTPGALGGLAVPAGELNEDQHASAAYRSHLISVLAAMAVERCLAGGDGPRDGRA